MNHKLERLKTKKSIITKEFGNSMTPLIKSGQLHKLELVELKDIVKGDIVYCKIKGNWYTHIVKSINKKRGYLIGNNHGKINGWTKQIYGKVTEIY